MKTVFKQFFMGIIVLLSLTTPILAENIEAVNDVIESNIDVVETQTEESKIWEEAGLLEEEYRSSDLSNNPSQDFEFEINKSDKVSVVVVVDEEILNDEDNYAYAVQVDFENLDASDEECNIDSYLEGDYGIKVNQLTALSSEGYKTSSNISFGEYLVSVVIPGDYKGMYEYKIEGTDQKDVEFAGKIISYPIVNTKNGSYDLVIYISKKKDFVDYLDSDETIDMDFNLDEILSGEYGESKAKELEETKEIIEVPEVTPNYLLLVIFIIVFSILLLSILIIVYIRYQVNRD